MHKLNWEDLRFFDAVARFGGLSKAARFLGVNHSTVFRRIASLEKALGARLFERQPEGYLLTSAGDVLLASTRQIDEAITAVSMKLSGQDQRLVGLLRVTTTDSLGHLFLQPYLADFHRTYPDIHIELDTHNTFFNLTKRQADVAVRPTNSPPQNLIGRKTCKIQWAVYGSHRYLRERGRPAEPDDLMNHDIVFTDESLSQIRAMQWLKEHITDDAIVLYGSSIVTLFAGVRHGMGLAALPTWLGDSDDTLARIMPLPAEADTDLWLLTHPDLRRTARVMAFMDFMAKAMRDCSTLRPPYDGETEPDVDGLADRGHLPDLE